MMTQSIQSMFKNEGTGMSTNIPPAGSDDHVIPVATWRTRLRAVSSALVLLSGLTALPAGAAGAPDPYLQALDVEGDRLESLGKARKEQEALLHHYSAVKATAITKTTPAPAAKSVPATSAPVLDMQSFENALRQNFPGSFALYSLMEQSEKEQVYAEFQNKKGEGNARFIPVVIKIIAFTNATTKSRIRAQSK